MLVVSSGVTNGFNTITNQGFTYDPSSDSWTAIPNAQFPRYRAGGGCGFYKIGGSSGGFSPTPDPRSCPSSTSGGFTDVPWLSESPTSGTISAGRPYGRTGHGRHARAGSGHDLPGHPDVPHEQRPAAEPGGPGAAGVPALGLNSGGSVYTSVGGEPWLADRAYTAANQAGYIQ